jgi:hypothetical protein
VLTPMCAVRPPPPPPPVPVRRVVLDGRGETQRPLVFFWNIGNMHWNILRIRLGLHKEIELFEPMGCVPVVPLPLFLHPLSETGVALVLPL